MKTKNQIIIIGLVAMLGGVFLSGIVVSRLLAPPRLDARPSSLEATPVKAIEIAAPAEAPPSPSYTRARSSARKRHVTPLIQGERPEPAFTQETKRPDLSKVRFAALQGHAPSQLELGLQLLEDATASENGAAGIQWIKKSAEAGQANAQFCLALLNENAGSSDAVKWYLLAARQGHRIAQSKLGDFYRLGKNVPQDLAAAAGWYQKAAEQHDLYSQFAIGMFYENGIGISKNPSWAANWYRRALRQTAEFSAKSFFRNGTDWPLKSQWAALWYRNAITEMGQLMPEKTYVSQTPPADLGPVTFAIDLEMGSEDEAGVDFDEMTQATAQIPVVQGYDEVEPLPQNSHWLANRFRLAVEQETGISLEERYGRLLPENISPAERGFLLGNLYFDECDKSQQRFDAAQWQMKDLAQSGGAQIQNVLVRNLIGTEDDSSPLVAQIVSFHANLSQLVRAKNQPSRPAVVSLKLLGKN